MRLDCPLAIIVDDIIDTAGTVTKAAAALHAQGAGKVYRLHRSPDLLAGPALARATESSLTELVVSDTVPLSKSAAACPKIRPIGTERLFGEAIARIYRAESLSTLFV